MAFGRNSPEDGEWPSAISPFLGDLPEVNGISPAFEDKLAKEFIRRPPELVGFCL